MTQLSAGILLFRRKPHLQLLLAHPGGPLWEDKDEEAWMIPTFEVKTEDNPLDFVKQQFEESLGFLPDGDYLELGAAAEQGDTSIKIWATEYTIPDDFIFEPYWFEMEWPPDSGQGHSFPEMDRIEYFGPFEARKKIQPAQRPFISRLVDICSRTERP